MYMLQTLGGSWKQRKGSDKKDTRDPTMWKL